MPTGCVLSEPACTAICTQGTISAVMLGTVMTKTPVAVLIFGAYVLGNVKVTQSIIRVIGLFVRK